MCNIYNSACCVSMHCTKVIRHVHVHVQMYLYLIIVTAYNEMPMNNVHSVVQLGYHVVHMTQ